MVMHINWEKKKVCYYCLSQQSPTEHVPLSLKLQKTSEKAIYIATVHILGLTTYFHLQKEEKKKTKENYLNKIILNLEKICKTSTRC